MLMTMEERCNDFICKIYDYVDGDVKRQVKDIRPVAKEWGYSESEVDSFLAHFDQEVIPERRMHAKGSGDIGAFTVTHDITRYTKAKLFSEVGKQMEMLAR